MFRNKLDTADRWEVYSPLGMPLRLFSILCLDDVSKATETLLRKPYPVLCFW